MVECNSFLLGPLLVERMERALDEGDIQTGIFTELTEAIEAEDASKLAIWRARIMAWEAIDRAKATDKSCPYYVARSSER